LLPHSFIHIPGVGSQGESALWASGITNWDELLEHGSLAALPKNEPGFIKKYVLASQQALSEQRYQLFAETLGGAEAWRAWPHFSDSAAYLDIETDGGKAGNSITCIGVYGRGEFKCFVRGDDIGDFPDYISHFSMIVTFFGSSFDLPMIKKRWPSLHLDQIHIDLCPTLKRVDLRGGLKKIEAQLGIDRGEELTGVTGYDAVLLWRKWERGGSSEALEKLIRYNREDVVNLETLAKIAYDRLYAATIKPYLDAKVA